MAVHWPPGHHQSHGAATHHATPGDAMRERIHTPGGFVCHRYATERTTTINTHTHHATRSVNRLDTGDANAVDSVLIHSVMLLPLLLLLLHARLRKRTPRSRKIICRPPAGVFVALFGREYTKLLHTPRNRRANAAVAGRFCVPPTCAAN